MHLVMSLLCIAPMLWMFPSVNSDHIESKGIVGNNKSIFLQHYMGKIQNYIMTGHEMGWQSCDILSANIYREEIAPQISMDLDKIRTLNIKSVFSFSHCILIFYHVNSKENLASLVEFGLRAHRHMRVAMLIKMKQGISLEMTLKTTRLPFMIGAELHNGKIQFNCPMVGKITPGLERHICNPSYATYKDKVLRIVLFGVRENFHSTKNGIDGVDVRLLHMLAEKLRFKPQIIILPSFAAIRSVVCKASLFRT